MKFLKIFAWNIVGRESNILLRNEYWNLVNEGGERKISKIIWQKEIGYLRE